MITKRICVYPKDIMMVTGRSERYARTLLRKIKKKLNKGEHQLLAISEAAKYFGLQEEELNKVIS